MEALGHQHITNYFFENVLSDGKWERVMTVETDLQLDPQGEGYDADAEQNLLSYLASYLERIRFLTKTIHFTTVRLKPDSSNA